MKEIKKFEATNANVGTTLESVGEVVLNGLYEHVVFELTNTSATVALADFAIQVKAHPDGEYVTLLNAASWAGSAAAVGVYASAAPGTLAAEGNVVIGIKTGPVHAVRFMAKGDNGSAATTITGTAIHA